MEIPLDKVWIENNKIVWAYKPKSAQTHEYVRKDAFFKKLEKWLKEHILDYAHELNCGVGKAQPDYYTKHFIENLKEYMEE